MLSQQTIINYKYYTSYNISKQSNDRPSGGVAILISSSYPHSHIILNTNLQAVAIRLSLHKTISVCSIYLPPNTPLDKAELSDLIDQLPRPAMLLGDFNAHNPLWGSSHMTPRGKQIEEIIGHHDLCFLNDGSATYVHPANGTTSCIDLALCHPQIYIDFDWSALEDSHGSDHFPTIIVPVAPLHLRKVPCWKLSKADWNKFHDECLHRFTQNPKIAEVSTVERFSK
jgi:hypothetical protein